MTGVKYREERFKSVHISSSILVDLKYKKRIQKRNNNYTIPSIKTIYFDYVKQELFGTRVLSNQITLPFKYVSSCFPVKKKQIQNLIYKSSRIFL